MIEPQTRRPTSLRHAKIINSALSTISNSSISSKLQSQIINLIKIKATYTINIDSLCKGVDCDLLLRYFKHVPIPAEKTIRSFYHICEQALNSSCLDMIIYKGTPIILNIDIGNIVVQNNLVISLITLNTKKSIKVLKHFVNKLIKDRDNSSYKNNKSIYKILGYDYFETRNNKPQRTFDSVFIKQDKKTYLIDTLQKFLNNKSWYLKHHIPYHYGIVLYGPPGTGKTSLIYAISNYFNIVPFFIPSKNLERITSASNTESLQETKEMKLIVVEDIDTCPLVTRDYIISKTTDPIEKQNAERYLSSTSDFLNLLDGINAIENCIWIFTTNHIERIDKAILRAGRMDVKLNIDYVCDETLDKFLMHHFHKNLPKDRHVIDDLSFADVQLSVMENKTFEEIIEIYTI